MIHTLAMIVLLSDKTHRFKCFNFDLDARSHRCFSEELPVDRKIAGSYRNSEDYGVFTDFRISNPSGDIIFSDTGKSQNSFFFETKTAGEYRFCFYNRVAQGIQLHRDFKRQINFDFKTGNEAKDYTNVATKYHLKPIQIELRVMEDIIKNVQSEYLYFREREAELRKANDSANSRTLWFSAVALLMSIAFAYWQFIHLRNYFQSIRLID